MSESLTPKESVRLCELERVIQKGKDTFVEVGTALAEIRDSKIYRATFKTFEDYCQERWQFTRGYVNKVIAAANVVSNLDTIVSKPETESQARPLTKLPADRQPAAWEKAQEKAKEEGKPVAARHVEAAVAEVMEPETLVVDDTKQERAPRLPKYIPDDADRLWTLAHAHLEKILPSDKSREKVLNEVITYAKTRISTHK